MNIELVKYRDIIWFVYVPVASWQAENYYYISTVTI